MYLPLGTLLNGRYEVEAVLGHGGFGITYAAYDQSFGARVAIKEYLPRHLATRGEGKARVSVYSGEARRHFDYGLKKFMEEAQLLAQFAHHPNVVSARDYFEANGTAYMVMEYAEGVTLKDYLEKKGGRISFEEARGIMMPVMDALREVHQVGLLHRDISPDNIYITTASQVRVIDFGAARYFAGEQSKSLSVILKSGYAPEEQYRSSGHQGPWTDVYAVGATLYKLITGQTPPDALDRMAGDTLEPPSRLGVAIPPPAERALLQALEVNASQRFQSMGEFQQALLGGKLMPGQFQLVPSPFQPAPEADYPAVSAPVSASPPVVSQPPQPSHYPQARRRSANPAAIAAGSGIVIIGLILVAVIVLKYIRAPAAGAEKYISEGYAHFQKQEYDQAIASYQRAIQLEPRAAAAYNMLGMAHRLKYNQMGTPQLRDKEIEAFKKAIEIDPKSWVAMINLASTYYALGEKTKATPLLKKALEINPNHPEKSKILQMIAENEVQAGPPLKERVRISAICQGEYDAGTGAGGFTANYSGRKIHINFGWKTLKVYSGEIEIKRDKFYLDTFFRKRVTIGNTIDLIGEWQNQQTFEADTIYLPQELGTNLSKEDLRREVEKLAEKIRSAHLNKDINKWLSCYHSSYPNLGRVRKQMLELRKNYDIKEVNYRISNVQRVSDTGASADIVWNIQLYDHRTHDYTLVRKAYQTIFKLSPDGWQITDSMEIADMPVALPNDRELMSMDAFTPIVQGYDSIREGEYEAAKNHFVIAVKRDHNNPFALNNLAVLKEREGELNDALIFLKDGSTHANKYSDKVTQTCFAGGGSLAAKPLREKGDRSSIAVIIQENINKLEAKAAQMEEERRKEEQRLGEEEQQQQAQKMPSPSTQGTGAVFYVRTNHLNMRSSAGFGWPLIEVLERNVEVEKLGQMEQWAQVRVKRSGQIGWVDSRYLSAAPVAQY